MKQILILTLITITLVSCDTTKDQLITRENIESVTLKLKAETALDSLAINVLDNLGAASKGREAYLSIRLKNDEVESLQKYIVGEKTFEENTDNLFKFFTANKVTYKMLLIEIDSLNSMIQNREKRLMDVYQQVDEFCAKKQKDIDEKEKKASVIKDSLNKMVEIKILSIRETEIDYRDVVQVGIQMTNKTKKRIEAISFNLDLTDKLGTKLATLGCRTNDGFLKSDVGYWIYDRWENDGIYKSLRNTNVSHVTTKQEVTRLNLDGVLISAYDELNDFVINSKYTTPKKLNGHCPYLDKDNELMKKVDSEEEKMSNEIKSKLKIWSRYTEFSGKFFDFTSILG